MIYVIRMYSIRRYEHVFYYIQTCMIPSSNWWRCLMIHAYTILSLLFRESTHELYSFILISISEASRVRRLIPTNIKKTLPTISSIKTEQQVSYSFHKSVTVCWVCTVCLELLLSPGDKAVSKPEKFPEHVRFPF